MTVIDDRTSLLVRKSSNPSLNSLEDIHEDYLYKGSENPLVMSRFYTVTLHCAFNLTHYPFDRQKCPLTLSVPFNLKSQMYLQMDTNATNGPLTFLQVSALC